jgi:hypothetical protein
VVLVEDLAGGPHVEPIFARLAPREVRHPLEVRADHRVLGGRGRRLGEPLELALRLLQRLLGEARRVDALAERFDLVLGVLGLAELLADLVELLAQHVVALRLAHLALDLLADLALDRERLASAPHLREHAAQARAHVGLLEELLLGLDVELEVRRREVGQPRGLLEALGEHLELVREARALGHERDELIAHVARQRRGFDRVRIAGVREHRHAGAQERILGEELLGARARDALHDEPVGVVGELEHLHDAQDRPDLVHVRGARAALDVPLHGDGEHQPLGADEHGVDHPLRPLRVDEERREQERVEDGVLERQHRKLARELRAAGLPAADADRDLLAVLRARDRDPALFLLDFAHSWFCTSIFRRCASRFGRITVRNPSSSAAFTCSRSNGIAIRIVRSKRPKGISIRWRRATSSAGGARRAPWMRSSSPSTVTFTSWLRTAHSSTRTTIAFSVSKTSIAGRHRSPGVQSDGSPKSSAVGSRGGGRSNR